LSIAAFVLQFRGRGCWVGGAVVSHFRTPVSFAFFRVLPCACMGSS
jgi:hypothetical protein